MVNQDYDLLATLLQLVAEAFEVLDARPGRVSQVDTHQWLNSARPILEAHGYNVEAFAPAIDLARD
jgi:hypothetical protein